MVTKFLLALNGKEVFNYVVCSKMVIGVLVQSQPQSQPQT